MNISNEFELRRRLGTLAGERMPQRDLWPQIRTRLEPRRRRRFAGAWPYALAAGVALAIGLAAVLPHLGAPPEHAAPLAEIDGARADPADDLLAAYTEILAAEQAHSGDLPSRLYAAGSAERLAAARELDASLAQLAAALRVEPDSQLLRRLMHQTLQQRAALTLDTLRA